MSGNKEREFLQCPECIVIGRKTKGWTLFCGDGDRDNWDRLIIETREREKAFLHKHKGKKITKIKCFSRGVNEKIRHVIMQGENPVFDRVMLSVGFEDGVIT